MGIVNRMLGVETRRKRDGQEIGTIPNSQTWIQSDPGGGGGFSSGEQWLGVVPKVS